MAVYTIRNKNDLKGAFGLCRWLEQYQKQSECDEKQREYLEQLKRDIRSYERKSGDRKDNGHFKYYSRYAFSYGDSDDGYVELIMFPINHNCDTIEEAEEFFKEWFYIEPYYTYYDCTGKPFTSWYHVFKRRGTWFAYHRVNYDV